jgi:hypothetical protein
VTEGALNADLVAHLDPSMPTVGVRDVGGCREALKAVRGLGAKEVRYAFYAGWQERKDHLQAAREFHRALEKEGQVCRNSLECWEDGKPRSLGELLAGGERPHLFTHEELVANAEARRVEL